MHWYIIVVAIAVLMAIFAYAYQGEFPSGLEAAVVLGSCLLWPLAIPCVIMEGLNPGSVTGLLASAAEKITRSRR